MGIGRGRKGSGKGGRWGKVLAVVAGKGRG